MASDKDTVVDSMKHALHVVKILRPNNNINSYTRSHKVLQVIIFTIDVIVKFVNLNIKFCLDCQS